MDLADIEPRIANWYGLVQLATAVLILRVVPVMIDYESSCIPAMTSFGRIFEHHWSGRALVNPKLGAT